MAFNETALLDRIAYGFAGGPTWLTTKVELYSGVTARNAERSLPLYRYTAPYDAISTTNHAIVVAAFNACRAGLDGFRFKDWSDYSLVGQTIGTTVGGAGETMQLAKAYVFGSTTISRTIKKPTGQVTLLQDGGALASTTDTTTGIVTFTSAGAGKVVTVSVGDFDVPVRFVNDSLDFNFVNWQAHSADIELIEDRI